MLVNCFAPLLWLLHGNFMTCARIFAIFASPIWFFSNTKKNKMKKKRRRRIKSTTSPFANNVNALLDVVSSSLCVHMYVYGMFCSVSFFSVLSS